MTNMRYAPPRHTHTLPSYPTYSTMVLHPSKMAFLATLIALHLTPVTQGQSFKLLYVASRLVSLLISPWHIIIPMTRRVLQRCHGMFFAMGALTRTSFPLTSYIRLLLESASLNLLEIRFILTHPIHPFMDYICFSHTEFYSRLSLPNKSQMTPWVG